MAEDVIIADSLFRRMKGLLGRKSLDKKEAIVLRPCNSVHTFFMRFPIDVLFIDGKNKVVKCLPCLKPFRFSRVYWRAYLAVELSCGVIQSTATQEGDSLTFI